MVQHEYQLFFVLKLLCYCLTKPKQFKMSTWEFLITSNIETASFVIDCSFNSVF